MVIIIIPYHSCELQNKKVLFYDFYFQVEPHLDHREKGGYNQTRTLFYPRDDEMSPVKTSPVEVVMYVGLTTNRQYAGPGNYRWLKIDSEKKILI